MSQSSQRDKTDETTKAYSCLCPVNGAMMGLRSGRAEMSRLAHDADNKYKHWESWTTVSSSKEFPFRQDSPNLTPDFWRRS